MVGRLDKFTCLVNLFAGMQGQNTITLTYSGKISESAKSAKRRAAGCIPGYCRGMINSGTITSDLNSCDEVSENAIFRSQCRSLVETLTVSTCQ